MRLDKYLSLKNISTRSKCQKFLKTNDVYVNDSRILKPDYKLKEHDSIKINNNTYTYSEYVYFIMNKPKGYICSNIDEQYPSVLNLLNSKDYQTDLFTVGRLDVDTTGVLLITNDGKFAHNLLSPNKQKQKTYEVTLKNDISNDHINELESGILLDGILTKPAIVKVINNKLIHLTISEGKYHQVKRMITKIDNEVLKLHRLSFADYTIDFTERYIEINP